MNGTEDNNLSDRWRRNADGELRRETIPSMLRRLNGWDYRGRAIYQITVALENRSIHALGWLEVRRRTAEERGPGEGREMDSPKNGRAQGADSPNNGRAQDAGWMPIEAARRLELKPEEIEARVEAGDDGIAVLEALAEMPRLYPQLEILAVQLMPDHIHFVAFVKEPLPKPFGILVRGFKAGAAKRWKARRSVGVGSVQEGGREMDSPKNGRAQDADSPKNGRAQDADSPKNGRAQDGSVPANFFAGMPIWADGFQDTVLLHEGQLANMKRYLADNPRRLAIKRLLPDLFRAVSEIAIPLRISSSLKAVGHFASIGNRFLLDRPLIQVQVSRRDFSYKREPKPGGGLKISHNGSGDPIVDMATPCFLEKKAALFAAAKHGAVLISPCVSDGERQIAREALASGHPLIALQNKGFSPLQKPAGHYFDACSKGDLLLLAPAAWPYPQGEKVMTRFDATAMNRLCQWIVGEDAAEINYHGMRPDNIDALAREAARVEYF